MRKAELTSRVLGIVHYRNCVNRESLSLLAREFRTHPPRLRVELKDWRERQGFSKPENLRDWRRRMVGKFTDEVMNEEDSERHENGQGLETFDNSAAAQMPGVEGVGEVLPFDPPDNSPAFADVRA